VITVQTGDEVLFEPKAMLTSPARPKQEATVLEVERDADGSTLVTLELKGGMGRSLTPPPGSVPVVGEWTTYTSLKDEFQGEPKFPDLQDTPWTHGGPPPEYVPTDEDAREDWS
jgi:hypothetical protein